MDISKGDVIVGAMAVAVLIWQWPNIQEKQASQAASVAEAKVQMAAQDRITASKLVLDDSAKCAEERYQKGVEIVSDLGMIQAVPIQEGRPVVAGAYAKRYKAALADPKFNRSGISVFYLGRNVTVADAYGTTAIMQFNAEKGYAVAEDLCVTPNRALMASAVKQRPGLQRPGTGQ